MKCKREVRNISGRKEIEIEEIIFIWNYVGVNEKLIVVRRS